MFRFQATSQGLMQFISFKFVFNDIYLMAAKVSVIVGLSHMGYHTLNRTVLNNKITRKSG